MPDPSDTELDILKLFWRQGAMSAREAQAQIGPELGWADSTTRTVLERMRAKGLLTRRAMHGVAVYTPASDKVQVLGGVLRKLRAVMEIDVLPASAFTGSQILNAEEIAELETLLTLDKEEDQ